MYAIIVEVIKFILEGFRSDPHCQTASSNSHKIKKVAGIVVIILLFSVGGFYTVLENKTKTKKAYWLERESKLNNSLTYLKTENLRILRELSDIKTINASNVSKLDITQERYNELYRRSGAAEDALRAARELADRRLATINAINARITQCESGVGKYQESTDEIWDALIELGRQ